jgi:hypothetical protein
MPRPCSRNDIHPAGRPSRFMPVHHFAAEYREDHGRALEFLGGDRENIAID